MYNTFQLDDEFQSNSSAIKSRTTLNGRNQNKFMSGTITKNFFTPAQEEDSDYFGSESPSKKNEEVNNKEGQSSIKSRRSKKHTVRLTPIQQTDKVQVFQNIQKTTNIQEIQQVSFDKPAQLSKQLQSDIKKKVSRRRGTKKQESQPISPQKVQQKKEEQPIKLPPKPTQIFFLQQDQQQIKPQVDPITIPQTKINNEFVESEQEPIVVSTQIVNIITGSQYFNFKNQQTLKRQFFLNVRDRTTLKMEIVRDKGGFNTFWPEFHLHFADDSHYVMSSKKTSSRPTSTFIISRSRENFELDTPFYLGKMKSNVLGDILNVYGPGVEPSEAKQKKGPQRQLLATILFITSLFQIGKPREFKVFIKKPQFIYYKHFSQVKEFQEQIPLHTLYEFPQNKEKIRVLHNRQPVWMNEIGGYMLNFRGRVQRPSIKNFIVEQSTNGPDIVLFGKANDNKFNFDVSSKISPFIAFAIALSSFDSRLMCE